MTFLIGALSLLGQVGSRSVWSVSTSHVQDSRSFDLPELSSNATIDFVFVPSARLRDPSSLNIYGRRLHPGQFPAISSRSYLSPFRGCTVRDDPTMTSVPPPIAADAAAPEETHSEGSKLRVFLGILKK